MLCSVCGCIVCAWYWFKLNCFNSVAWFVFYVIWFLFVNCLNCVCMLSWYGCVELVDCFWLTLVWLLVCWLLVCCLGVYAGLHVGLAVILRFLWFVLLCLVVVDLVWIIVCVSGVDVDCFKMICLCRFVLLVYLLCVCWF